MNPPPNTEPVPTGRTISAGWQIGVSRTVEVAVEKVWAYLVSSEGLASWLGQGVDALDGKGHRYATTAGTVGEVRSLRQHDRIRLTWRPSGWDHDSTVQVAVTATGPARSVLRFHQERLADAAEREQQRAHWRTVLNAIVADLEQLRHT